VPSDCGPWIGALCNGTVTQIMSNTDPPCDRKHNPHWSPDGSRLTYWRDPYENGQPTGTSVFVIHADGTGEQRLTDPKMFAGSPDWSPDGRWIVFSTYPLNEFQRCQISNLYRMHSDGSGMEQLTTYAGDDLRATSRDMRQVGSGLSSRPSLRRAAASWLSRPRAVSRSSSPLVASTRTAPDSRPLPRGERAVDRPSPSPRQGPAERRALMGELRALAEKLVERSQNVTIQVPLGRPLAHKSHTLARMATRTQA